MSRDIKIKGIRRKEIDVDKLALAFLLLAKQLHDEKHQDAEGGETDSASTAPPEAA